jgi:hypothetical protein
VCIFIEIFSVIGCSKDVNNSLQQDTSLYSFISTLKVDECDCFESEIFLAQSALGLSPLEPLNGKDAAILRTQLQKKAAEIGSELKVISVQEAIMQLEQGEVGPRPLSILVHENGHLYGLFGTIDIDGERLFQLTHSHSPVWLATKKQIETAKFKEVWHLKSQDRGIPLQIGETELVIDKMFYNFGEIKPQQEIKCSFNLKNNGSNRLVLGVFQNYCSGTILNLKRDTKLEPGKQINFEIALRATSAASTRQWIEIKCFEEKSHNSQIISIELLGSQRLSMNVSPRTLNFGKIIPNEKIERTVTLQEVPTDRFKIEKIEAGNLPISTRVETEIEKTGLNFYKLKMQLSVSKNSKVFQTLGSHEDIIIIRTDSRIYPQIVIPIVYEIPPVIRAIPSIISFGTVKKGETAQCNVEFESRNKKTVKFKIKSLPDEMSFEKKGTVCMFNFTAKETGIWEGTVQLDLTEGFYHEILPLKCAAFVTE